MRVTSGQQPDQPAGAVPDLEDAVTGAYAQRGDHLVLAVGPEHEPAGEAAAHAGGYGER
ncbi:MAG: hypothetical protein ACRDOO_14790 [Actinomadura sp.]